MKNLCPSEPLKVQFTYPITSDFQGITDTEKVIPEGTTVGYLGHLPGLAIKVQLSDGTEEVMNPMCFRTFREQN